MNQESAKRARAAIGRRGELISLRRINGAGTVTARADVKATVAGYAPIELANGITAGSRKVIVSRLDLDAAGYPVPPKKGDRIYLGASFETPTTIDSVDADRREYQACYEISSAG